MSPSLPPTSSVPAYTAIVVMGVAGSGKTTLGQALAARLALPFVDGDDLHSAASKAKMAANVPLTDADRWPWLDRVGEELADHRVHAGGVVVACSALRKAYRDRLRAEAPGLLFVYLAVDADTTTERLVVRRNHFMKEGLVASQFATLEPPDGEADVVTVDATSPLDATIEHLWQRLSLRHPSC